MGMPTVMLARDACSSALPDGTNAIGSASIDVESWASTPDMTSEGAARGTESQLSPISTALCVMTEKLSSGQTCNSCSVGNSLRKHTGRIQRADSKGNTRCAKHQACRSTRRVLRSSYSC